MNGGIFLKRVLKGYLVGLLTSTIIVSGAAYAKTATEKIEALYNNIKIYVDGIKINPKDAAGNDVEPFIYNGTTYLPVRAVGEAIGKTVSWDGTTQSVYLGEKPGEKQYLVDVCPPYGGDNYNVYSSSKGEFLSIGGEKYTNGIKLKYKGGFALITLNGKYNSLNFTMGRPDEDNIRDTTVNFFIDDVLIKSIEVDGEALPKKYEIPLNHGLQLKIATDTEDVGIMDIVLN